MTKDGLISNTGNLCDMIDNIAASDPELAVTLFPERKVYSELNKDVNNLAAGFSKAGISKGSKVILMVPLRYKFFKIVFALIKIGAIPVMIDPGMGIFAMASALKMLKPESFIGVSRAHLFRILFPGTFRSVKTKIYTGSKIIFGKQSISSIETKISHGIKSIETRDSDTCGIFFTSGSTGLSKGVVYTKKMIITQIDLLNKHFNYRKGEVDLCTFPLIGLYAVCLGMSTVIASMQHNKPATAKPGRLIKNIEDFRVSHMFCSPLILLKLSRHLHKTGKNIPGSLKVIISSGAPIFPELLNKIYQKIAGDTEIFTPYGATEALPLTNISGSELLAYYSKNKSPDSGLLVGYELDGLSVRIIKINDNELNDICEKDYLTGSEGEIIVKGGVVSPAYYKMEKENSFSKVVSSKTGELWHRMGDLGIIDNEGRILFLGRKKHRVETQGETLFTIPVEKIFNSHPKVERSALIGIRDGDITKAAVCIETNRSYGKQARNTIIEELKKLGAEYKITRNINIFLFKNKLPVDPRHNAKIFREKLSIWANKKYL